MNLKNKLSITITYFLGVLIPLIEIYRSNHFILFDYEKIEYFIFSLFYLIIYSIIFLVLYKRSSRFKEGTLFSIAMSFYFIYYQKIAAAFFNIFRVNFSGVLFWFLSLVLILFFINKYGDILYNFVKAIIVVQIFLTIFTILPINESSSDPEVSNINFQEKPNIYFFVIDMLASQENLYSEFNLEYNFTEELSDKNNKFYLHSQSLSSYGGTMESISSIMEMDYKISGRFNSPENVWKVINQGYLSQETLLENIFIENGYTIFKYGIAFPCMDTNNIQCYKRYYAGLNSVSSIILENTPLNVINNFLLKREIYTLDYLFNINCKTYYCGDPNLNSFLASSEDKPSLHLIHLMNSHGPFFVDSNCNKYKEIVPYTDISINLEQYEDSINCLIIQMKEFVKLSNPDDIIFLQSDHGPYLNFGEKPNNVDNLSYEELLSIKIRYETFSISNINKHCKEIDDTLGGVNTFGFLINCLSDKDIINTDSRAFIVLNKDFTVKELTSILKK